MVIAVNTKENLAVLIESLEAVGPAIPLIDSLMISQAQGAGLALKNLLLLFWKKSLF